MKKTTFLLLSIILLGCSNPIENSTTYFENNINSNLKDDIKLFGSTIDFIYYSDPTNYWYSDDYTYREILNDKFSIGYRGMLNLKEKASALVLSTEETEVIQASEYLIDEIDSTLKELKDKQKSLETLNGAFGFEFGGVNGLLDLGNALSSEEEREEVEKKNGGFPELVLLAYSSLADLIVERMREMADNVYELEKTAFDKYSPSIEEKRIIRTNLQNIINKRIEKLYFGGDEESIENMQKFLWNYYDEKYEI
jgi:hypothetical protein|uniref:hypothetical protein n=1 Tax=Mariniflexile sp. TaxID=1979402 RepID=UPI004047FE07